MRFLFETRRAAIAALVTLLGAAAVFLGAGTANAADAYCRSDGTLGDATINIPGVIFVQNDEEGLGNPDAQGTWVCVVPPNQGAGVGLRNPNPSSPGVVFAAGTCGDVTGGCDYVDPTGAEVDPSGVDLDETGGGDGIGGVVERPEACVYADGVPTCTPTGVDPLAEVSVGDGDLPQVETEPGCVDVNGACTVPTVDGARVTLFGDETNYTLYVDTLVGGTSDEHSSTCVGVNYACP